mgnify:CR=1 FL=1
MYQFGFIGMGNMGSAMLKGCLSVFPASTLAFSRKDAVKGKALSLETGAVWIDSNRACAEQSRYIILAVKPQFYDGVLKEIQPVLDNSRIIISLAPSYTIADLKQSLGASARIIRAMPNTPAMVGEGMTGLSWSEDVFSDTERQELMQFFTSFGKTETVPENLMDAVTAVKLSRATIKNVKENLFWAFFYNTICIPLAAGLWYPMFGIKLNPMIGAAAMSLSSVCVVSNALRLKLFKPNNDTELDDETDDINNVETDIISYEESKGENVMKKEMIIEGMSCTHCSGRVEKALNEIDGVSAKVDLEKKTAYVDLTKDVSDDVLSKAVVDAGYDVVSVK